MELLKVLPKSIAATLILYAGTSTVNANESNGFPHFTGDIYPTPQKAEYSNESASIYSPENNKTTSCILIPQNLKKNDARILDLAAKIQSLGGKIDIKTDGENLSRYSTIISIGKTGYQEKSRQQLPQHSEGYSISFVKDNGKDIAILDSYDEQGLYWSIASLCQLFTNDNKNIVLKKAEVFDYPEYKIRGAGIRIKGGFLDFYNSVSKAIPQRYKYNTILPCSGQFWPEMLKANGQSVPDDYWRQTYPDEAFEKLKNTVRYFKDRKMDMIVYLTPHRSKNKIQFSDLRDIDHLQDFIRKALNAGCAGISLWLDDTGLPISAEDAKIFKNGGSAHAFLFRNIQKMMAREFPGSKLSLCSTLYMSNAQREVDRYKFDVVPEEYWKILKEQIAPEIPFIWNGPHVCSYKVTSDQADKMSRILDKQLLFLDFGWCGANKFEDYRFEPIPYEKRFSPDFHEHIAGYILPVWLTPEREIFYAQVGDFLWNPKAFNAEVSLKKAIEKVMGPDFYPLAVKYRDIISKFDATGFKVTPAAAKELKNLKAEFKNLQEIYRAIVESCQDKDMERSLKSQTDIIKKYIKDLESAQSDAQEYEDFLNNCIQKEVGINPEDTVLLSTQFLCANSGLYKYQCEPRYAAWVYGPESKSAMSVRFMIDERELGKSENAKLIICGQDDEDEEECAIAIVLNGNTVFKGKSGFGRQGWFIKEFTFPTAYLKRGENILEIKNTTKSENQYGTPWFGISYAVIRIADRKN